jgi:hypothetical protein
VKAFELSDLDVSAFPFSKNVVKMAAADAIGEAISKWIPQIVLLMSTVLWQLQSPQTRQENAPSHQLRKQPLPGIFSKWIDHHQKTFCGIKSSADACEKLGTAASVPLSSISEWAATQRRTLLR